MRKFWTIGLAGLTVMMLATGCSKATDTSTAAGESTTAADGTTTAAEGTTEAIDKGTVTLGDYKGISVDVEKVVITDQEIEDTIKSILEANPDYKENETAVAALGDIVNIDYKGLKDGEAFDGGTAEGTDLTLGSGQFIAGFEDGLVGARKGDKKSLNLTFPEDYQNADLAGQAVVFEVTVNAVKTKVIPELDEAFVAKISPDDMTVEKFRQSVTDMLKEQKQYDVDMQKENDLIEKVVANSTLEVNEAAVTQIYDMQISQYTQQATYYGMELKDFATAMYGMDEETFQTELKKIADQIVRQELVLTAIAEKENLKATDEEMESLAAEYGYTDKAEMIGTVGQDEADRVSGMRAALDFIVKNAVVNEVESKTEAALITDTATTTGASETTAAETAAAETTTAAGAN